MSYYSTIIVGALEVGPLQKIKIKTPINIKFIYHINGDTVAEIKLSRYVTNSCQFQSVSRPCENEKKKRIAIYFHLCEYARKSRTNLKSYVVKI